MHTRIIMERMREHGVPIERVIHGGGIPQKNDLLNQVYANVLNMPVLVPDRSITSLGSAIFAFLAAGTFATIEEAQRALCPSYRVIEPRPEEARDVRAALSSVPRPLLQPRPARLVAGFDRERPTRSAKDRGGRAGYPRLGKATTALIEPQRTQRTQRKTESMFHLP
jgi:hypothetical protein